MDEPLIEPLPYYQLPEPQAVIQATSQAKATGKTIVMASGVFDLLHTAHQQYLAAAKKAGDFLVVLVESDARTRELKGEGRPIWPQEKRRDEIKKLSYVDAVMILPPEFKGQGRYAEIVALLAPDIYAESSHSHALESKRRLMERFGARLEIVLDQIPGVSTTQMLKR